MKKLLVVGPVLVALVSVWLFYGRFAVEGGKLPWSVINDRPDLFAVELAAATQTQKERALIFAVQKGQTSIVEQLLDAGAQPNGAAGQPCLLDKAIYFGGPQVVRALLEHGADPKRCPAGNEMAASFLKQNFDRAPEAELIWVVRLLVEGGADPAAKRVDESAFDVAKTKKLDKVLRYLNDPISTPILDPSKAPKLARNGGKTKITVADLKKVCEGDGLGELPPYVKAPNLLSPISYFENKSDKFVAPASLLPRWWTASDDLSHTQLVACVRVLDKKVVNECRYEKTSAVVTIYEATYDVAVREAQSGKILVSKSVSLPAASRTCPMLKWGTSSEAKYPEYQEALEAIARPLVGAE